jgi:hypothetical protein
LINLLDRCAVLAYIKAKNPDLSVKVPAIHALDQRLSDWWQRLRPEFKLDPLNVSSVPEDIFPKVLLLNIAYHQSLCALHASIVPIFCWGEGDEVWLSARQLSAQRAYEHACAASELLYPVLSSYDRLCAMPSFISYAAYCGCAIQIPFLWSSNPALKQRAITNVRTNVRMVQTIADYWKFAALLVRNMFVPRITGEAWANLFLSFPFQNIYVKCLHNGLKRHPIILEAEPKDMDPRKLTSFKVNAPHAQASILEFSLILWGKGGGYVNSGEEVQLEVGQESVGSESQSQSSSAIQHEGK